MVVNDGTISQRMRTGLPLIEHVRTVIAFQTILIFSIIFIAPRVVRALYSATTGNCSFRQVWVDMLSAVIIAVLVGVYVFFLAKLQN